MKSTMLFASVLVLISAIAMLFSAKKQEGCPFFHSLPALYDSYFPATAGTFAWYVSPLG